MSTELTKLQLGELQKQLTGDEMLQLAQFTDISQVLDILKTKKWTGENELEELVAVANQNENLGAKVSAIKYLRQLVYDALRASGMMVTATRKMQAEDGSTITFTTDLIAAALQKKERLEKLKGEPNAPEKTETETNHPSHTDGTTPREKGTSVHKPPSEASRSLLPGIATTPRTKEE